MNMKKKIEEITSDPIVAYDWDSGGCILRAVSHTHESFKKGYHFPFVGSCKTSEFRSVVKEARRLGFYIEINGKSI
jgi:hypothetical protein